MSEYTDQQLNDAWEAMRLLVPDPDGDGTALLKHVIDNGYRTPEKPKTVREELADALWDHDLYVTPPDVPNAVNKSRADAILASFNVRRKEG